MQEIRREMIEQKSEQSLHSIYQGDIPLNKCHRTISKYKRTYHNFAHMYPLLPVLFDTEQWGPDGTFGRMPKGR